MKLIHINSFLLVFTFFLFACKKDSKDPVPVKPSGSMEPVLFNFTATWDSTCGRVSRPVFDSLRMQYPNALIINTHLNSSSGLTDPLSNSESHNLAKFYQVFSSKDSANFPPYAYLQADGFIGGFHSSGIQYKGLSASIDWLKENKTPAIVLYPTATVYGKQLTVKVGIYTLFDWQTEVFLAVYLTEDNLVATQVNDFGIEKDIHQDVFRACLTEFNGNRIAKLGIAKDVSGSFSFTGTLDPTWSIDNMKLNVMALYKDPQRGNMIHLGKRMSLSALK